MDSLKLDDRFSFSILKKKYGSEDDFLMKGRFHGELWRGGKLILPDIEFNNLVMTAAKDYAFQAVFNGGSQINAWYLSLIDAGNYTSISPANTMASHSGWSEYTSYSGSLRPAWNKGASASGVITGSAVSTFTINLDGTLAGGFVTSNSAIASTTGTLWSAGQFAVAVPVLNGDQFRLNYTLSS